MIEEAIVKQSAGGNPVCEVNVVHAETVNKLRPEMDRVEGMASLFKALSDDTRIKVVYALSQSELCVCDVAALIGGTTATASYHLRLLNNMGLAQYRRDGKQVYYSLKDPYLGQLVQKVVTHNERREVKEVGQNG